MSRKLWAWFVCFEGVHREVEGFIVIGLYWTVLELQYRDIEMIAPHRKNKNRPKTHDGRKLKRYERWAQNYLGFVYLGCIVILLRWLLRSCCTGFRERTE